MIMPCQPAWTSTSSRSAVRDARRAMLSSRSRIAVHPGLWSQFRSRSSARSPRYGTQCRRTLCVALNVLPGGQPPSTIASR
jgi:hypothetical protein